MARKKPAITTKNVNGIELTDAEDKMVQTAVKDITKLWTEHNVAQENAARIKIAIGDYLFDKFFGREESKLYDDKDKYHPRKVNSYAALLESEDFQKLDITPQTLRTMVYRAVAVKSLKSEGVEIMNLIEDKTTVWTYTHLKFLARLERNHAAQIALVNDVNEEKLSSRQLEEKVKELLPKNTGEQTPPEEYNAILLKVPAWITPVMQLQKDIDKLLAYNPTDENSDDGNYVDKKQRATIHSTIKDTIDNFNYAIKSLRMLDMQIKKKESESGSETEDTPVDKAA